MNKSRLAAFSDGLFAVIITIMVLELNAPRGVCAGALVPLIPIFLSYALSFVYVAMFWINHHHLLAVTRRVNTPVLWGNLNFLFWLSLIPFFTSWIDENHVSPVPVAAYGMAMLMVVISYRTLELLLFRTHDADAPIVRILRSGRREYWSMAAFVAAIGLAFAHPFISLGIYVVVAVMWIRPHRELDKIVEKRDICTVSSSSDE